MSSTSLFTPLKVGEITLQHRIAMAPLTRYRADEAHVHGDIAITYYSQRASVPGTLLISEATTISEEAGGYSNVPGIYTDDQINAWKKIVDAVHSKGSFIFLQLWAIGRTAEAEELAKGGYSLTAPSAIGLSVGSEVSSDFSVPTPMTQKDIKRFIGYYAQGAKNAVEKAGFDGVEIHAANGYLVDQFIQDVSNKRTDQYGGSIENRSRFALEVVGAVAKAVGPTRTGIRFSPWSHFNEMRMTDPVPQFSQLIAALKDQFPTLAYIHLVEPIVDGSTNRAAPAFETNDFARELWKGGVVLTAGGYSAESAKASIGKKGDVIVFGKSYTANVGDFDFPSRDHTERTESSRTSRFASRTMFPLQPITVQHSMSRGRISSKDIQTGQQREELLWRSRRRQYSSRMRISTVAEIRPTSNFTYKMADTITKACGRSTPKSPESPESLN